MGPYSLHFVAILVQILKTLIFYCFNIPFFVFIYWGSFVNLVFIKTISLLKNPTK
ncbi:hypothetical protein HanRHA438_Chr12g0532691 [Helianthus annuus]|nr:hypothetical protein HanRHA438_Chr12g0532691 [Helianthus annuus]